MEEQIIKKWESIIRVAKFGLENGKSNMIVDLDVLVAVDEVLRQAITEAMMQRQLMEVVAK